MKLTFALLFVSLAIGTVLGQTKILATPYYQSGDLEVLAGYLHTFTVPTCSPLSKFSLSSLTVEMNLVEPTNVTTAYAYGKVGSATTSRYAPFPDPTDSTTYTATTWTSNGKALLSFTLTNALSNPTYISVYCPSGNCHYSMIVRAVAPSVEEPQYEKGFPVFNPMPTLTAAAQTLSPFITSTWTTGPSNAFDLYSTVIVCRDSISKLFGSSVSKVCLSSVVTTESPTSAAHQEWTSVSEPGQSCANELNCWATRDDTTTNDPTQDLSGLLSLPRNIYVSLPVDISSSTTLPDVLYQSVYTVGGTTANTQTTFFVTYQWLPISGSKFVNQCTSQ